MIEPDLLKTRNQLIRGIRRWSTSQAQLWQQVPYWAAMANGRWGWQDSYHRAGFDGVWTLEATNGGCYVAFVDCATGELTDDPSTLRRMPDLDVLQIKLRELDVTRILKELHKEAAGSVFKPHSVQNEAARQEILQAAA